HQRYAIDGGRVSAFSALGKALVDERRRVLQPGDRPAGAAFAAEIVRQPLAIGGLPEHPRQREFSHAARPREQHGVGDSSGGEHSAQSGNNSRITEKFREWHERFGSFAAWLWR